MITIKKIKNDSMPFIKLDSGIKYIYNLKIYNKQNEVASIFKFSGSFELVFGAKLNSLNFIKNQRDYNLFRRNVVKLDGEIFYKSVCRKGVDVYIPSLLFDVEDKGLDILYKGAEKINIHKYIYTYNGVSFETHAVISQESQDEVKTLNQDLNLIRKPLEEYYYTNNRKIFPILLKRLKEFVSKYEDFKMEGSD